MKQAFVAAVLLSVAACNQPQPQNNANFEELAPKAETRAPHPPPPPPATGSDAKTPFGELKGTIDPKSVEAAARVVQDYAGLLEHHHFAQAALLWSNKDSAMGFADQLHPEVHVKIGKLGQMEGAAGSVYTTIPVFFFGDTYSKPADVILRRVNDVPGSTEAQRRWHIERIDWNAGG